MWQLMGGGGGGEKCLEGFDREIMKERDHFEGPGADGSKTLRCVLKNRDDKTWAGLTF
jgi:hypothetical protein